MKIVLYDIKAYRLRKTLQKNSLESGYWEKEHSSASWASWAGYAFEAICYKHLSTIRKKLNISPSAIASAWRYVARSEFNEKGAQIDLLFDRKDDAITLCEIKYTDEPFLLTKDYVEILKRKMEIFKTNTRTNKQLFLALISANGIKNNYYAEDNISSVVTLSDLFL